MNDFKQNKDKPRYRFRQCLITSKVICINAIKPSPEKAKHCHLKPSTYERKYYTVTFPSSPGRCPKCKGKGTVYSQLTGKLLGVCFWCDGKGNINSADIVNAQRRIQSGLGIDNKSSY